MRITPAVRAVFGLEIRSLLRDARTVLMSIVLPVLLIPVGEVFYNLDQMIRNGEFAGTGVDSIKAFYKDRANPSDQLGAYATALTFYASLTGIDPHTMAPTSAYLPGGYSGPLTNPVVQTLIQDAGSSGGISHTEGLRITVCP